MPLFLIEQERITSITQDKFPAEKELQHLIEANLPTVFRCRFVASEFSTGLQHGGRIDTLALSEDNNPVIIEYKNVESSELVNQSLYYLHWIQDHRGDFDVAVQRKLGKVEVDWTEVRVICIAPSYNKFALHAVQVMGAQIELWTFRLFKNKCMLLEEVVQRVEHQPAHAGQGSKNPVMVEAGKKAALARAAGSYKFEEHLAKTDSQELRELVTELREFILKLDPAIEEAPKKFYVAYRTTQNIACVEVQRQKILLVLKLDPAHVKGPEGISRNVSNVGHYGTGDLEITLRSRADFEAAKPFVERAYEAVGA